MARPHVGSDRRGARTLAAVSRDPGRPHRRTPLSLVPLAVAAIAAVAGTAACSGDAGDGSGSSGAGDDRAAATDASAGADVYAETCAACHGEDLRGTDRGPSHLSIVYEPGHHSDESFRSAILQGSPQHHWTFGDMPPVEGLDDDQIDAVIAYVREVQEREGFEPYPPE